MEFGAIFRNRRLYSGGVANTKFVRHKNTTAELEFDKINDEIAIKKINVTKGTKVQNADYFKVFRMGKLIIIHATFQISSATSTTETIFTIDSTTSIDSGFSVTGNDRAYKLGLVGNEIQADGTSLPPQWYSGTAVFVDM